MAPGSDDREFTGLNDDMVGRALYEVGGLISEAIAGRSGRDNFEDGMEQLTDGATPEEISAALEAGIASAQNANQRRKALRQYHEEHAVPNDAEPAIDTTLIENEAQETVGIRVFVSDPSADVFAGKGEALILVDVPDSELVHRRSIDVPFEDPQIEFQDPDAITEFVVRPTAQNQESHSEEERKKRLADVDAVDDDVSSTGQDSEATDDVDDVIDDLEADAGEEENEQTSTDTPLDIADGVQDSSDDVDEREEPPGCVYCDDVLDEDPAEHHLEEHPDERYDPVWYADEDNQDES